MSTPDAILCTELVIVCVFVFRFALIMRVMTLRHKRWMAALDDANTMEELERLSPKRYGESPSMFDLSRWTYRQFFPEGP